MNSSTVPAASSSRFVEKNPMKSKVTISLPYRNRQQIDNDSATETELEDDSLYDKEDFSDEQSQAESMYRSSKDIRTSMDNLSKGINKVTKRYVRTVKKQVNGMLTNIQEQPIQKIAKPSKKLLTKPPNVRDFDDISQSKQELLMKMQIQKKKIYEKIEANLKALKCLDNLTDELLGLASNENWFRHQNYPIKVNMIAVHKLNACRFYWP